MRIRELKFMKGQVTSKVTGLKIPQPDQTVDNCSILTCQKVAVAALEQRSGRNLCL